MLLVIAAAALHTANPPAPPSASPEEHVESAREKLKRVLAERPSGLAASTAGLGTPSSDGGEDLRRGQQRKRGPSELPASVYDYRDDSEGTLPEEEELAAAAELPSLALSAAEELMEEEEEEEAEEATSRSGMSAGALSEPDSKEEAAALGRPVEPQSLEDAPEAALVRESAAKYDGGELLTVEGLPERRGWERLQGKVTCSACVKCNAHLLVDKTRPGCAHCRNCLSKWYVRSEDSTCRCW
eukprot:scaffold2608_cov362-Prasinococcus_capsulatus_cf.AAC.3